MSPGSGIVRMEKEYPSSHCIHPMHNVVHFNHVPSLVPFILPLFCPSQKHSLPASNMPSHYPFPAPTLPSVTLPVPAHARPRYTTVELAGHIYDTELVQQRPHQLKHAFGSCCGRSNSCGLSPNTGSGVQYIACCMMDPERNIWHTYCLCTVYRLANWLQMLSIVCCRMQMCLLGTICLIL